MILQGEKMTKRQHTKILREGNYLAEVDIEIVETGEGWSPYLSLDNAKKLDEVRETLRNGDIKSASEKARIFILKPA
jgi:hypothetical protein